MAAFGILLALGVIEASMRTAGLLLSPRGRPTGPSPLRHGSAPERTILCLGESTTAPVGGSEDHSWPRQMESILNADESLGGVAVVNMGVPATNSQAILEVLPGYLEEFKPDLVIAMIGVNDLKWYGIPAQGEENGGALIRAARGLRIYKAARYAYHEILRSGGSGDWAARSDPHLDRIVRLIRQRGIPLILMQYPGLDAAGLAERFGRQEGLSYVDNRVSFERALQRGRYEDLFTDRFAGSWGHCTALGDRLIARNAAEGVRKAFRIIAGPAGGGFRRERYVTRSGSRLAKPVDPEGPLRLVFNEAEAQLAAGHAANAETLLDGVLRSHPDSLTAFALMLDAKRDRPKEALPYAARAVSAARAARGWARAMVLRRCARVYRQLNDPARAAELLREGLEAAPEDFEALIQMAELEAGEPGKARPHALRAKQAALRAPRWERERLCREGARISFLIRDAASAEELLKCSLQLDPGNLGAVSSMLEVKRDRPREALPYAERAVKALETARARERAEGYRLKARAQLAAGDAGGAKESLERALELTPVSERAEGYGLKARAQLAAGDAGGAKESLQRALKLSPESPDKLRALAELSLERGRAAEAVGYADRLTKALETSAARDRAAGYRLKARAQLAAGDAAGAKESLKSVPTLEPGDLRSLWSLIQERRLGLQDALDLISEGRPPSERGRHAAWLAMRGLIRSRLGREPEALEDLTAALTLSSMTACYGLSYSRPSERADRPFYDLCLKSFPDDASLYLARGVALRDAAPIEGALSDFRRAIKLKPDYIEAHLSLASALAGQGRRAQAREATRRAMAVLGGRREGPLWDQLVSLDRDLQAPPRSP